MQTMNPDIHIPARITMTHDADTITLRYHASGMIARMICAILIVAVASGTYWYLRNNLSITDLWNAGLSTFFIFWVVVIGVIWGAFARGFNVTTIQLTPTTLISQTAPLGFGKTSIKRNDIKAVSVDIERTIQFWGDSGFRINRYSIRVTDKINQRYSMGKDPASLQYTTVKNPVRGRTHAHFIALVIAQYYELQSAKHLEQTILDSYDLNPIVRLWVD